MNNSPKQRETKQRRLVYEAVMKHHDHPSVDEIYLDVHEQDERISKATVYRNLKLLAENGEITHVKLFGADRYDSMLENHYHVVCCECGKTIDAPLEYLTEKDDFISDRTGFKIMRHRTVFEGICPECRKKAEEANKEEK